MEASQSSSVTPLAKVPFFAELAEEDLAALMRVTRTIQIPRGTILFEAGDESDALYIITAGKCAVYIPDYVAKKLRKVAELGPGSYFGEMGLIDGEPRSATILCASDTTLIELDGAGFDKVLRTKGAISRKIMAELSNRIRALNSGSRAGAAGGNGR